MYSHSREDISEGWIGFPLLAAFLGSSDDVGSSASCFTGPLTEKNLRRALMQLLVFMDSYMCTAHILIHMKSIVHLLFAATPPLVRRVPTIHGPKTSNSTYVNGGDVLKHSGGRSAIFWTSSFPVSLRHVTQ